MANLPTLPQYPQPLSAGQAWRITAQLDGQFFEVGPPGASSTGTWTFQFVPDPSGFDGALTVMGRASNTASTIEGAPLVAIAYFARYLNGVIQGTTGVLPGAYTTDAITGSTLAELTSGALSLGFLVGVNSGGGTMYFADQEM